MDLTFTAEQDQFRTELRGWLTEHPPPEVSDDLDLADEVEVLRAWQALLASGSWVGVAWPPEVGGRGVGPAEHYIVQEELARAGAPELVGRIGVNLVGPTLLAHGTPEQKQRWLPRILDGSQLWCQLFSEPGAGSDLAGLTTRAVRVEGGWRVTGQKVWTSYAQFADWGICLARSDVEVAKQRGISCLVIDMHADGVTTRPLVQLTGESEFNEVFLDEVFVPDDQLVGEANGGWAVAGSTLAHERGTSPRQLVKHVQFVGDLLARAHANGSFATPRIRQGLAQAYADVRIFQLHNWRSLSRLERGLAPGPEGSQLKLFWSERTRGIHDTALEVLGTDAPLWGPWQRSWLYYRSASIFAGTNEIQRNIVGERVLGLPRE